MSHPQALPRVVSQRLWQAGLTPRRHAEGAHLLLGVEEYPGWRIRCHQARRWHLWGLFSDALAENPDPSGYPTLITVDRRDRDEVATFSWGLLAAWLRGESPPVLPRRRARTGFAHHRLLQEVAAGPRTVPLLASQQGGQALLLSLPLVVFKAWLASFPAGRLRARAGGEQLPFTLWEQPPAPRG